MKAAFIVSLDVETLDPNYLKDMAEDLFAELNDAGYDVLDVKPWSRHKYGPNAPSPFTLLE